MSELGERIRIVRNDNKLTQQQFADKISVSRPFVSRIEAGKEKPSDSLLKLIVLEFKISNEWLINGSGSRNSIGEDADYFRDTEMQQAVNDGLINLFKTLSSNVGACSEFEKKMIFDILLQLKHLLRVDVYSHYQKTIAIETIRNTVCYTSLFIDACLAIGRDDDFEKQRIEELKQNSIKNYSTFMDELIDTCLYKK